MKRLLVLGVLAATGMTPLAAGIGGGNGEIGIEFGFSSMDSAYGDNGGRAVFRAGYHFTDRFELELHAANSFTACTNDSCADLTTYVLDAVVNFHPGPKTVPYVLAGAGIADRSAFRVALAGPSLLVDPGGDGIALQAAAGCRWFVGSHRRMALRAELSLVHEDTFDDVTGDGLDGAARHVHATFGLSWRLGRRP